MRKWQLLVLVLTVPSSALLLGLAAAQDSGADVIFSRYRHFRIPFQTGPGEQRLKQLQLFVSTDQGKTWQPSALAPPDQKHFRFICDRDGLYWFSVQTLDQDGRYFPVSMDAAQPSLKVMVDTTSPVIQLRPLAPRGGEVGVAWEIRDDNLDLTMSDAMRLEFRVGGGIAWTPLQVGAAATQYYWNPETNAPIEVRLRARDRGGNVGEATTTVGLSQQDGGAPFTPNQGNAGEGGNYNVPYGYPGEAERRLVNSKRISLNYELKDVGPSGVSTVELWFTQDGRSWNKYPLPRSEDAPGQHKPLVIEVNGEGVYGFTLVAKSGVGLGERPPQIGDRPQIWVEVDMTRPIVQLYGVVVGQGADKGKLTVNWTARDKNLSRQPIIISYGEQAAGPWTPVVQNAANSGRYVWSMPERVPYQFLLKVEAVDQAGNIGEAVTPEMIKVDLSQPRVKILNVESAGK